MSADSGVPVLADDAEIERTMSYPHLVVRIMSGVYQRESIRFLSGEGEVLVASGRSFVRYPNPFTEAGEVSAGCRDLLIRGVQAAVRATRLRMCIVWSRDSCTFVELDSVEDSDDPPSGGIQLPEAIQFEGPLGRLN